MDGRVLRFAGFWMMEFLQCFSDVTWHGDMDVAIACFVVPMMPQNKVSSQSLVML